MNMTQAVSKVLNNGGLKLVAASAVSVAVTLAATYMMSYQAFFKDAVTDEQLQAHCDQADRHTTEMRAIMANSRERLASLEGSISVSIEGIRTELILMKEALDRCQERMSK